MGSFIPSPISLIEVENGSKVPWGLSADRMGAGIKSLDGSVTSVQAILPGGSYSNPVGSFIPSPVVPLFPVSDDLGGVLSFGSPLARPAFHCLVAPCTLPLSDCVFTPSIVSTNTSTSSEGRSIRYALRSREISFEGSGGKGLPDLSLCVVGKGRGRKSLLSKAQDRAKVDLGMGTQSSIEWALRAEKAQVGYPK